MNFLPTQSFAHELDKQDTLKTYRDQFVIDDLDLVYFDGNSLRRMPKIAIQRAKQIVEEEWLEF